MRNEWDFKAYFATASQHMQNLKLLIYTHLYLNILHYFYSNQNQTNKIIIYFFDMWMHSHTSKLLAAMQFSQGEKSPLEQTKSNTLTIEILLLVYLFLFFIHDPLW